MSVTVIKPGVLDTFQDAGRVGYGHYGVNPSGPMDKVSMMLANALVANPLGAAVLEMHFPAPVLHFSKPALIALAGAHWETTDGRSELPSGRTLAIPADTTLKCTARKTGERLYLAVQGGFQLPSVLGSKSTNLKAGFGGWQGRNLRAGDDIPLEQPSWYAGPDVKIFPWRVKATRDIPAELEVLPGPELEQLTADARQLLFRSSFRLLPKSDRMAARWQGPALFRQGAGELVSSPVTMGTIQLLPSGEILTLMADHQTIGGYPRILQVTMASLSALAQMPPGTSISWKMTDIRDAGGKWSAILNHLRLTAFQVEHRLSEYLNRRG